MRLFKLFSFFVITAFLTSCAKDTALVGTDKNLEVAEFDTYKTFTFADQVKDLNNNQFFWDSELMKMAVANEVKAEMDALGYVYKEKDADLLLNFRVFESPVEVTGFVDNYADENYWGPMEIKKEAIGLEPSAQVREPGDARTYNLEEGSIFVQMVDIKKSALIWQGYVSGVVENASIMDDDEEKIAEAVELLFEEYNFKAAGYASK